MVSEVTLTQVYLMQCITVGICLSLWIGARYTIMMDRKLKRLIDGVSNMERKQMELEEKEIALDRKLVSMALKKTRK